MAGERHGTMFLHRHGRHGIVSHLRHGTVQHGTRVLGTARNGTASSRWHRNANKNFENPGSCAAQSATQNPFRIPMLGNRPFWKDQALAWVAICRRSPWTPKWALRCPACLFALGSLAHAAHGSPQPSRMAHNNPAQSPRSHTSWQMLVRTIGVQNLPILSM